MKKLLPIILIFLYIAIVLVARPTIVHAQSAVQGPTDSRWVIDPEVTFIGKNARRSGDFLDWTLENYNWVCVKQISAGAGNIQCDDSNNPIEKYWSLIVLYIVVPMLFLVILATSIVIIITRGKSLTVMRFIPRFIAVILLIVFSYSLLQFFYQFTDLIQGFFLRSDINQPCPPNCISDKDLLYVGWDYNNFVGLRLLGDQYAESAFISLLLTKLTALTYFVMVFLLLVRKIILWFFIIVSPIFPILLLYYPVRNTGKIWIGEFFRWLLYAPLFAIFLNGLVYLWRNQIPLVFTNPNIGNAADIEYPTAVNILLGGPRQQVTPTNSVNLVETFALYVVSLIMLWIVILLPWILLQIFLDYAQNFAPGDTAVMKTLVNLASKSGGGGPATPQSPSQGGAAISLPFTKKFSIPPGLKPGPTGAAKEINVEGATLNANFAQPVTLSNSAGVSVGVTAQVMNVANLQLPTMRDIARFDVAMTSNDVSKQADVSRFSEQLVKISNPVVVTNTVERDRVTEVREKIVTQSKQGNPAATAVLNAANASTNNATNVSNQKVKDVLQKIANPSLASSTDKQKMNELHSMLKSDNSQLSKAVLSVNEKTSDSEVQKIKEQLGQSNVSKAVISAISSSASTTNTASVSTQNMKDVLQQIANPSLAAPADRQKMTDLHTSLKSENSQIATAILSVNEKTSDSEVQKIKEQLGQSNISKEVISAISSSASTTNTASISTQNMKDVLQQIANPSLAAPADRQKMTDLHTSLKSENSQIATAILSVNEKTSDKEVQKIKDQLNQATTTKVSKAVSSAIIETAKASTQMQTTIKQIANPDLTTKGTDKDRVEKLRGTLEKASKEGNQLASSILSVSSKTSTSEIEALQERIQQAQDKGEPLAAEFASVASTTNVTTLPMVNKLQNVRKEDFQAVKDMWKQNYQNLEIPVGMAGSRSDWMKEDISSIDQTVALLSSPDQDKVQQGMDQVSNILPFLLVGGFSQTEIINYLKAKQEAAKEVAQQVTTEEEDKVSISTKSTHAEQTMAATMTEENTDTVNTNNTNSTINTSNTFNTNNTSSANRGSDSTSESEEESPLQNVNFSTMKTINQPSTNVSNDTSEATNSTVNTSNAGSSSNASNDTSEATNSTVNTSNAGSSSNASNDTSEATNSTVNTSNVASSSNVSNDTNITTNSSVNNSNAGSSSSDIFSMTNLEKPKIIDIAKFETGRLKKDKVEAERFEKMRGVLKKIANPSSFASDPDHAKFETLRKKLADDKEKGDISAANVLTAASSTGEQKDVKAVDIPEGQELSSDQYEEVKKLWIENYKTLPVPEGYSSDTSGRIEWIKKDSEESQQTFDLLKSSDTGKKDEGLKKIGNILPFLLLGGFSYNEMTGYLQAKIDAAKESVQSINEEESTKVTVTNEAKESDNAVMQDTLEDDSEKDK
jgi:hypothetical protein